MRQFSDQDLVHVYKGLSHPDVIRYYGVHFSNLESTKAQIHWYQNLEESKTGIWWAICSKEDRTFHGAGGLSNVDSIHRKAEIGFWLLPVYWGTGIMKEVMPIICRYGFDQLDLHRIEGYVDSRNVNCQRALAKLEFNYEGTMIDCEYKNGEYISLDIYASINAR